MNELIIDRMMEDARKIPVWIKNGGSQENLSDQACLLASHVLVMGDEIEMLRKKVRRLECDTKEHPPVEACGFCSGSGHVPGPRYDREGRHRPDWPDRIACEYCGGSGAVEDGAKLLPARRATQD